MKDVPLLDLISSEKMVAKIYNSIYLSLYIYIYILLYQETFNIKKIYINLN